MGSIIASMSIFPRCVYSFEYFFCHWDGGVAGAVAAGGMATALLGRDGISAAV